MLWCEGRRTCQQELRHALHEHECKIVSCKCGPFHYQCFSIAYATYMAAVL
jgi:hypothetical protein